jgi:hypothetical protein
VRVCRAARVSCTRGHVASSHIGLHVAECNARARDQTAHRTPPLPVPSPLALFIFTFLRRVTSFSS